jgi:hypothetical protein
MIEDGAMRLHVPGELCEFVTARPADFDEAMKTLIELESNREFVFDYAAQRDTARHIVAEYSFALLETSGTLDVDRLRKVRYAAAPADLVYDYFARFIQLQQRKAAAASAAATAATTAATTAAATAALLITLHERYIQFVEEPSKGPALQRSFVYVPATMATQLTFARLQTVLAQLQLPPSGKPLRRPRHDEDLLAYLEYVARCYIAPLPALPPPPPSDVVGADDVEM